MIYLLSGAEDKRKEALLKIGKEYSLVFDHIYEQDLAGLDIHDRIQTQTDLFGGISAYVIHDLCRSLDLKKLLTSLADAQNIFVFSEASLTKKISELFEKQGAHIEDFGKEVLPQEEKMNIFSLADAFGRRDRKTLWLLFQEAQQQASPEEIHGILFWEIKNLFLVKTSETNPGMNPYVYTKTKGFAEGWTEEELLSLSARFLQVFHTRDMYRTLNIDLERIILSL